MRIGIDARELCGKPTGVGRYLLWLLSEWAIRDYAHGHQFLLYVHDQLPLTFDDRRFASRVVRGQPAAWWEQVSLPSQVATDHVDVFFAPGYTTALRFTVPTIVAIHDLSFFAHPEWFSVREGLRRRWLTYQSAVRARVVLTISEFTKRELIDRLGLDADRIHVVPPGITGGPPATADQTIPYVLFVGSIFNRRRVPDLIRAFAPVASAHPAAHLDIVGDNRSSPYQNVDAVIRSEGLDGRATWRSYVPDETLRALYRRARAFVFLSEYEGLGLTPLEALAWGVPPILLDTPVARESCQDAALYVTPGDVRGVTRALEAALFDVATRARLLDAAPRVVARFDARDGAHRTFAAIVNAV